MHGPYLHHATVCFSASELSSIGNQDVDQYIENAVATLKLKLHKAAQRHEGRRRRSLAALPSDISSELF